MPLRSEGHFGLHQQDTKPALNPQTFEELIQRLKQDEQERRRAIDIIQTRGVLVFGDEYFVLTDKQRDQLTTATADPAESFRWRALLSQALAEGANIGIDSTTQSFGVHIDVHSDGRGGWGVSISISCEI
ncbi:hypothetical protein [Streptomyces sp. SS]|uniref:hypothetical protein n=1 Tax=Streptomyces sp. SS TaxID=260742 RepID=UPI0003120C75|nr:hypothetical protein [Streptomyces sp. SS]